MRGDAHFDLEAQGLGRIYSTPAGEVTALADLSVKFCRGQVSAIMGPSGSGKTTLLNLLAGIDTPTSGKVLFEGRDIGGLKEPERAQLRRTSFGIVFQSFNLVTVLGALQNVALPMALAGVPARRREDRARELLERFGLAHRVDSLPYRLSGGERQRVALARALANDPGVLFADEPTGNLDSNAGEVVAQALRAIAAEGRTVIVVTHDAELAGTSDRILTLKDGRLVADEPGGGR